jgi:hypothetical protein
MVCKFVSLLTNKPDDSKEVFGYLNILNIPYSAHLLLVKSCLFRTSKGS